MAVSPDKHDEAVSKWKSMVVLWDYAVKILAVGLMPIFIWAVGVHSTQEVHSTNLTALKAEVTELKTKTECLDGKITNGSNDTLIVKATLMANEVRLRNIDKSLDVIDGGVTKVVDGIGGLREEMADVKARVKSLERR